MTRNELADQLLDGCPDDQLQDHKAIADAIRNGKSFSEISNMPETEAYSDTYHWLKNNWNEIEDNSL